MARDEACRGGGGTAGTVLSAARLSAELALAALAVAAAGAGFHVLSVALARRFGHGVWSWTSMLEADTARREVVMLPLERDSVSRRHRDVNGAFLLGTFVLLAAFPLTYMQYLGTSRRVCLGLFGGIALAYLTVEIGYVALGVVDSKFISVLGFLWLYASLLVVCPRGSSVPRQALRQLLVVLGGNILALNVASTSSDLEHFFNTFVVLNLYRELGRFFVNQGGYYLTVAEFPGSMQVNRDAALPLVAWFHVGIGIAFRLELSNFDSEGWALATVAAQAALEVVTRVTALERDAWFKSCARRCRGWACRGARRSTKIAVSAATPTIAHPDAPGALSKQQHPGPIEERRAEVSEFHSRVILTEMVSEYAGFYIATFLQLACRSAVLAYPLPAYRKQPGLFDGISDNTAVWKGLAVQLAFELLTDTVCVVIEARKGLDPLAAWRKLPKASMLPTCVLVTAYGTIAGTFRAFTGADNLDACTNTDMCYCVGHGLQSGGIREAYCKLIYFNTSGVPGQTP